MLQRGISDGPGTRMPSPTYGPRLRLAFRPLRQRGMFPYCHTRCWPAPSLAADRQHNGGWAATSQHDRLCDFQNPFPQADSDAVPISLPRPRRTGSSATTNRAQSWPWTPQAGWFVKIFLRRWILATCRQRRLILAGRDTDPARRRSQHYLGAGSTWHPVADGTLRGNDLPWGMAMTQGHGAPISAFQVLGTTAGREPFTIWLSLPPRGTERKLVAAQGGRQ